MKRFRYLLIPIIIILMAFPILDLALANKCDGLMNSKDISKLRHEYNNILRDRGALVKNKIASADDLMILGSSELSSNVEQNPINIFPFKGAEYDVSIIGRAHIQSLQQAAILNSIDNLKPDSKIVMIVSLQWFERKDGMDGEDYCSNFSPYQFYKMMNSDNVSHEDKLYYAQRNAYLLEKQKDFYEEYIYSKLYSSDQLISKGLFVLLKPYFDFKQYSLKLKDEMQVFKYLIKQSDDVNNKDLKDIDWNSEYVKADEQGKKAATNNDLNVDDEYYDTYLRDIYASLEGKEKDVKLLESQEIEDYKYFMDIAKIKRVKPLIVLMPVNGIYYDYLGISREEREDYYDEIQRISMEYGFDVLNLKDKDYEKYYLKDVMHLGWRGWLNVNEEIYEYFKER